MVSLGAPETKRGKPNANLNKKLERDSGGDPLTASFSAAAGGSNGRLIFLISLMGLFALGAGFLAYRRRSG